MTVKEFINKYKVRMDADWVPNRLDMPEWNANHYKITLKFKGKKWSTFYSVGSLISEGPKLSDVLYCLSSDARAGVLDFEDFCGEFGYDTDSRKAEKTWKACAEANKKAERFFGDLYHEFLNLSED